MSSQVINSKIYSNKNYFNKYSYTTTTDYWNVETINQLLDDNKDIGCIFFQIKWKISWMSDNILSRYNKWKTCDVDINNKEKIIKWIVENYHKTHADPNFHDQSYTSHFKLWKGQYELNAGIIIPENAKIFVTYWTNNIGSCIPWCCSFNMYRNGCFYCLSYFSFYFGSLIFIGSGVWSLICSSRHSWDQIVCSMISCKKYVEIPIVIYKHIWDEDGMIILFIYGYIRSNNIQTTIPIEIISLCAEYMDSTEDVIDKDQTNYDHCRPYIELPDHDHFAY